MEAAYQESIKRIAEMLKEPGKHWALTGAGISTESGIPDYRSPGTGLWNKTDPTKVASAEALRSDPVYFFKANLPRWAGINKIQPNIGHFVLSELERKGFIQGVITQNVDSLHKKAGTKTLYEVHGHLRTGRCTRCSSAFPFQEMWDQFNQGKNPPRCSCGGIIRPDVVLFGDMMCEDFSYAQDVAADCETMLVIGSSLTVHPVAGLPGQARRLAIINLMPTPYDRQAEVVIHEKIGQTLSDLAQALGLTVQDCRN